MLLELRDSENRIEGRGSDVELLEANPGERDEVLALKVGGRIVYPADEFDGERYLVRIR